MAQRFARQFDAGHINQAAFEYYSRLARVEDYVRQNYSERISLADAAEIAALEAKYFSTFFHNKTGVCFKDWLSYVRVSRAMQLIRSGNSSITAVAFDVGFQNLRTFERAFKRCTGETPQAYKNAVRPS